MFGIDRETCRVYDGTAKVMPKALAALAGQALACIEDPLVTKTILAPIDAQVPKPGESVIPDSRTPPQASLFS